MRVKFNIWRILVISGLFLLLAGLAVWRLHGHGAGAVILAVVIAAVLLDLAVVDFYTQEIPDWFHVGLAVPAVLAVWVFPDITLAARGVGFFAVSAPMLGLALVKEGAFGGGDIKLMAVCGFLLGWQGVLVAFFVAVLLGGGWAVYLLASGRGKRGQHMAFGPALCVGIFFSLLWGADVLAWYMAFF